ncbi:MAG: hypothetical protein ACSHWN_00005 [Methylophilaceae bacterium]
MSICNDFAKVLKEYPNAKINQKLTDNALTDFIRNGLTSNVENLRSV